MNRNTIIALVLSLGILMMWQIYVKKNTKPVKYEKIPPVFAGLKEVTADNKNGYLKLEWDKAEDETSVMYLIFLNKGSKVTEFKEPNYYTEKTSYIISDLDISSDYYFVVRAVDANENREENNKQVYFKSKFKKQGTKEKIVEFENDVAVYYFSSLGGKIKNIVLKNYKTMDGKEQVRLLKYDKKNSSYYYPLDLKVLTKSDNYEMLKFNDQTPYSIKVSGKKVILTATLDNELEITKEYEFEAKNYHFNLKISLNNSGNKTAYRCLALKWQPTLGPEDKQDKYNP